eukprot:TRINITY_DN61965_c0_g1_i1.p1 TRINITY_DN61965_c0_g1~~TRINITY_DN61965_c0_g1_i1.p1  ORF type:complete len:641 (+),score=158.33 TRINITY_DN61965_c0_g1_i1:101-1924(+)
MIDAFYIFTKGGLLLWSTQLVKVKGDPLDRLIKEVLLEERVGETSANLDSYSLKWLLKNELDLFFVVVYQGVLQLTYLESLLTSAAKEFVNQVSDTLGNGMNIKRVDFEASFRKVILKADKERMESRRPRQMSSVCSTKKGKDILKSGEASKNKSSSGQQNKGDGEEDSDGGEEGSGDGTGADGPRTPGGKAARPGASAKLPKKEKVKEEENGLAKPKKTMRHWAGSGRASEAVMKELDFSKPVKENGTADVEAKRKEFLGSDDEGDGEDVESLASESEDEAQIAQKSSKPGHVSSLFRTLTSSVKNLTGGAVLTEQDLRPILNTFRTSLLSKNVGVDVADKLADSVRVSLVGKTTERFTSMSSTVKKIMYESMETILTPKKSIDVLRAAIAAKNAGRVYSIAFLGVNGVGKSTNLAKVAYHLKIKGGLNVMLCACDTFRAGAVEQLKTHARCLDVELFERGYGKDPADIAKQALAHAKTTGIDVVLIDTAGRMQDNEPLMRALANLVAINKPDLVLFVGEALVGNDAIDQVTKFNRSLIDYSRDRSNPRGIDGMLLTKYDTVDDKVGAALSMVYVTGQPIVFVGTGQKYTHLRKLQAKEVASTLLG